MKWPLLPVALLYIGGILLADLLSLPPFPLLWGALGLSVISLAWARARLLLLWPLLLLTGAANVALRTAIISPHDLRGILGDRAEIATVRGVLRATPSLRVYEHDQQQSWRSLTQIELSALRLNRQSWQPAFGRMALSTPGTLTNFFAGQTVEITGIARSPKAAAAPGTFDYRKYLSEQGIYYQLQAESTNDWRILFSPPTPPLAERFRAWARQALALGLPVEDESLRLEWALTLGWKTALTEEVSEPFIRAATYHIFAVDGLRMAIIFAIFFGLFRALGLSRVLCGAVVIPLIWFYTALTGWPASAIRASVMLTVVIGGWALKRPSESINSLFAAALIILLWQPQQLFQAGFQLSFFVVLCIILIVPVLHQLIKRLVAGDPLRPQQLSRRWPEGLQTPIRFIGDTLITSLAAWIGSLPLVAYYFHILTPVSTPANLVAVPLCALVLVSNLSSLLLAGWFPYAAQLFNHAGWFLMECIRVTSFWFANWPRAYFYVPAPSLFTSTLYHVLLLTILTGWLFKRERRVWKTGAFALALLIWCWGYWQERSATRLTILPLRGGWATYFDAPGTKNDLLINCGDARSVESLTKPFLRAQGVNRLQGLLLTHGDSRYVGGAGLVADLFSVPRIYASPVRFRSPAYREVLEQFSRAPRRLQTIGRGDWLGLWTILHPEPSDHFAQADDNAVVLLGDFGGIRVLLLSDLGRPGQNALLERMPDLRADIIVTGLPSQGDAACDALLDTAQPRVIIVGESEFPASERARARLRERLALRHVTVIYTRSDGAATVELRENRWEIRTMNGIRIRSPN